MKNLHNALQLKQLLILKQLGHHYTDVLPHKAEEAEIELPHHLEKLREVVRGCHLCQLSKHRQRSVFGEGNPAADLMFVGESPGISEESTGKPFAGRAGEMLTKIIENVLLIPRDTTYITTIVKCRPPENRLPAETESLSCLPFLQKQIALVRPKIIVTLGAFAYRSLANDESALESVRGTVLQKDDYLIVPSFDPSYLLKNPSSKKEALQDFLKIKSLLEKP